MMNTTRSSIFKNSLLATAGLVLFGFGTYLTIQANIGVAPWETLNLGLSKTFGISFGTASIAVSLFVLAVDVCLREKIGIGMLLDAFIVGKTVDFCNWLQLIPAQTSILWGIVLLLGGLTVMGFSQYLYMKAALGCGPRDTLLVGLKRRIHRIPIGFISIAILVAVTAAGWLLGGSVGIGTVISVASEGLIMQGVFHLVRFVPTSVRHQSLAESLRVLIGR